MSLYPREILTYLALQGIPRGPNSNIYLADPVNGDNNNTGDRWTKPVADIATAEGLCVANQHDVVLYLASSSGVNLSAALTWDKNYTHLIGLCAPTNVAQRARIFQLSTLTSASPLLDITATGCMFKNFYIFQGVNDAGSLLNVRVTGGRNFFKNVHFAGGGHATQAIDGGASLALYGAEECTFEDCTIGVDTVAAATGMMAMRIDSDAKRCIFKNCRFTMYAGHAGAGFVEVVDSAGFDRYMIFENCLFINDAVAFSMNTAFVIPAGMGSATHRLLLKDCAAVGVDDWDDADRGILFQNNGTITVGGNAGLMLTTVTA